MKLTTVNIRNFRSIKENLGFTIRPLQALIGENNAGKSNIMYAIDAFLSAGAGGVSITDFNDPLAPIIIGLIFKISSPEKKKIWKPYMINDELILEKHIWIETDGEKQKIESEFHGYKAEPKEWYLSIPKIHGEKGTKPKWKEIATENNLPDYFFNDGNCNKDDYTKGLQRYLSENEVEFEEPDLSKTQALGFPSKAIANLPKFYLLKAQSSFDEEMDKRSSSSNFRKLMSDLTERIIKNDPKYGKIDTALKTISNLLNDNLPKDEEESRITGLTAVEERIKGLLSTLMPSVEKVKLKVALESVSDMFSKGVELRVDDGVETNVLAKGHGLQRCVVFSLLHALILNERKELLATDTEKLNNPIILAIEEPELYIHPQLGKLFYDVLVSFANTDQVIYTTHSPRFIDVFNYESIAVVKKTKVDGTKTINCDLKAFANFTEHKVFQWLAQLNSDVNELFFAKNVIVVEGPADKIAITETAKKLNLITTRTEELDVTVVVAGGKESIPFFIRVLNAFKINYGILHDLDLVPNMPQNAENTEKERNGKIQNLAPGRVVNFPITLENTLGTAHFQDQYTALKYFSDHTNINVYLENIVENVLQLVGAVGQPVKATVKQTN